MSAVTAQLDTLIVILAAIGLLAAACAVFYRAGRSQERARWRGTPDTTPTPDTREP